MSIDMDRPEQQSHNHNEEQEEQQKMTSDKTIEFLQVFEDIVLDIDADQLEKCPSHRMHRRSSVSAASPPQEATAHPCNGSGPPVHRRHSGYESLRFDQEHELLRQQQQQCKVGPNQTRAELIEQLVNVHSVMDLHMMPQQQQQNETVMTPAMQYECPIFNYLEVEDEDSVELVCHRKPELISMNPEGDDFGWEQLEEHDDGDPAEYTMPLTTSVTTISSLSKAPSFEKRHRRRRQRHSYQIVQEYLEDPNTSPVDLAHKLHKKGSLYDLHEPDLPFHPAMTMTYNTLASKNCHAGGTPATPSKDLHAELRAMTPPPPPLPRQHLAGVARGA